MANVRDILINLIGKETVSSAAKKAADGMDNLGDRMQATARDAEGLDREIEQAQKGLQDLALQFARTDDAAQRMDLTKAMRKQQSELRRLTRTRDLLPDLAEAGAEAATGFGASFVAKVGPILAKAPVGPAGMAIGATLLAGIAPILGAGIGGIVLGGAGVGGVIGGVVLASKDARVKAAGKQLGESVMGDLEDFGSRFVDPTLRGIGIISAAWDDMADDVDGALAAASRFVEPLARGVAGFAQALGSGLRDGLEDADPIIRELSAGLVEVGAALGDMFRTFGDHADEGASATRLIFDLLAGGVDTVSQFVGWMSEAYRWLVNAADATSLWATTMAGWMPGLGDHLKDSRARVLELKAAMNESGDEGAESGEKAAGGIRKVGDAATTATPSVRSFFDALSDSVSNALDAEEANIRMASAYRNLRDAAKDGADKGINPNTEAGERNRRALLSAAQAANANANSIRKTTGDHQRASAVTEQGRAAFLRAADAMGVERREALRLATQLFRIPNVKRDIDVNTAGARNQVAAYKRWLASVNLDKTSTVRQRIVAEQYTARGGHREFSQGGAVTGSGPKGVDSVPAVLAVGEHVLTAREVDAAGGHSGVERLRAALRGGRSGPATMSAAGGSPAGGATMVQYNTVHVQAGYVVSEQQLEDRIARVLDDLRRKGRA